MSLLVCWSELVLINCRLSCLYLLRMRGAIKQKFQSYNSNDQMQIIG
jgi:hypothetical protein